MTVSMAPPETAHNSTLSADDVLSFDDAHLVQYLKQHRRPAGGFQLEFDWTKLSPDRRGKLAERLKFGARKVNETVHSQPIDLDQVTARLLEAPPLLVPAPRWREPSPQMTFEEAQAAQRIEDLKTERLHHDVLVSHGGRPCYPVALLEQVSEDPEAYPTLLQGWSDPDHLSWRYVFKEQWHRWEAFRVWQLVNRGVYDEEDYYPAFLEVWMRETAIREGVEVDSDYVAAVEAHPRRVGPHTSFDGQEDRRRRDYPHLWKIEDAESCVTGPAGAASEDEAAAAPDTNKDGLFGEYVERVRHRLARHEFTRPFQLDKDPQRQDKMTTWIEYLNYEYAWYDRYTRSIKRLKLMHDEAWAKLVATGLLPPGETAEHLMTIDSALERQREETAAERALEAAEANANAILAEVEAAKRGRGRLDETERGRRLRAALALLPAQEAVKKLHEQGRLTAVFAQETMDYRETIQKLKAHEAMLQWILGQIPIIEDELSEAGGATGSGTGDPGRPGTRTSPTRRVNKADNSRRTRSGRIGKKARPQRQRKSVRGEELRLLEELGEATSPTTESPRHRPKRWRKTYVKERSSRRLSGDPPDFGLLAGRGQETPRFPEASSEPLVKRSSTRRSNRPLASPVAGKGAKPKGISKRRPPGRKGRSEGRR